MSRRLAGELRAAACSCSAVLRLQLGPVALHSEREAGDVLRAGPGSPASPWPPADSSLGGGPFPVHLAHGRPGLRAAVPGRKWGRKGPTTQNRSPANPSTVRRATVAPRQMSRCHVFCVKTLFSRPTATVLRACGWSTGPGHSGLSRGAREVGTDILLLAGDSAGASCGPRDHPMCVRRAPALVATRGSWALEAEGLRSGHRQEPQAWQLTLRLLVPALSGPRHYNWAGHACTDAHACGLSRHLYCLWCSHSSPSHTRCRPPGLSWPLWTLSLPVCVVSQGRAWSS